MCCQVFPTDADSIWLPGSLANYLHLHMKIFLPLLDVGTAAKMCFIGNEK